jgi:hypothetical protein
LNWKCDFLVEEIWCCRPCGGSVFEETQKETEKQQHKKNVVVERRKKKIITVRRPVGKKKCVQTVKWQQNEHRYQEMDVVADVYMMQGMDVLTAK